MTDPASADDLRDRLSEHLERTMPKSASGYQTYLQDEMYFGLAGFIEAEVEARVLAEHQTDVARLTDEKTAAHTRNAVLRSEHRTEVERLRAAMARLVLTATDSWSAVDADLDAQVQAAEAAIREARDTATSMTAESWALMRRQRDALSSLLRDMARRAVHERQMKQEAVDAFARLSGGNTPADAEELRIRIAEHVSGLCCTPTTLCPLCAVKVDDIATAVEPLLAGLRSDRATARDEYVAVGVDLDHATDRLSDMVADAGLARPESLAEALDAVYALISSPGWGSAVATPGQGASPRPLHPEGSPEAHFQTHRSSAGNTTEGTPAVATPADTQAGQLQASSNLLQALQQALAKPDGDLYRKAHGWFEEPLNRTDPQSATDVAASAVMWFLRHWKDRTPPLCSTLPLGQECPGRPRVECSRCTTPAPSAGGADTEDEREREAREDAEDREQHATLNPPMAARTAPPGPTT